MSKPMPHPLVGADRVAPHGDGPRVCAPLPLRRQLEILDEPSEQAFDRILTLAADLFGARNSGILFQENGRYWHRMRGDKIAHDAVPGKNSFARHTLDRGDILFVTDAALDPRFRDHPRVAGEPHLRFYVGAPLFAADGHPIGVLAVVDGQPHATPTDLQERLLRHLASDIVTQMQSRVHQYTGELGRATRQAIIGGTSETVISVASDWTVLVYQHGKDGPLDPVDNPNGADLWSVLPAQPNSRLRHELIGAMTRRSVADFEEFIGPLDRLVNFRLFPLEPSGLVICCREAGRASFAEFALRASEARLHRSEHHLSRAQRLAEVGSAELDLVTGDHYCSEEMYRIFGVPQDAGVPSIDEMLRQLIHPEDRERVADNHRRLRNGESVAKCEYRIIRADGSERVLLRFGEFARDADGKPCRFLVAVQDVTELRAAERKRDEYQQQLHHAQRLDALGTLAGGIAHDLNNTLLPILALTKLLQATATSDDDRRNLDVIQRAGERARDLVRQVLTFSRKVPVQRKRIDLRAVISDSLRMMRASVDPRVRIEENLAPVPVALGDSGQIHQVVVNLVTNAVQAIGDRAGTVSISLDAPATDSSSVRFTVSDDGVGMNQHTLSRMFEPFFTTRGLSVGTGLGLSIVHSIVIGHGGKIAAESSPGNGTRIDIDLPVQAVATGMAAAAA